MPKTNVNNIKKELDSPRPNTKSVLKSLIDLRANKKIQQPSDSEFFDIVGETFKLNPNLFMKELYKPFMNKMGKIIGTEKRKEMEKYIIEKFCLFEDEQILYECKGKIEKAELHIEQKSSGKYKMDTLPIWISISSGDLFFTNYRIIAHGVLKVSGGRDIGWDRILFGRTLFGIFEGRSKRVERKDAMIESSPLFGYNFPFPINNHMGLNISKNIVGYKLSIDSYNKCLITIKPTIPSKREEDMKRIFDILRKDKIGVLNVINEIMETDIFKQDLISSFLEALRKSKEYEQFSDSDYLDIVKETYKLNSKFFMTFIYPKMMSWKFPSFLNVKDEVITLIDKLSKEL